jgi:2-haloacid dehalogenase
MMNPAEGIPPERGQGAGRRPAVLVFDVNETLSDMAPLADRFADIDADPGLARTWFASLLRDGFALAVNGVNPSFATLAAEQLHQLLDSVDLNRDLDDAVAHVLAGFAELRCHPDVAVGLHALSALGLRLVTLTNGATSVTQRLLNDAGLIDAFEFLLSGEQAGFWKPDPRAYAYALSRCGVQAAEAMLVTVHPWDTDGARRAGLSAAWVNRAGVDYPTTSARPRLKWSHWSTWSTGCPDGTECHGTLIG